MEVFPTQLLSPKSLQSFLHIRGGVSNALSRIPRKEPFSPHTWRCFSNPTSAVSSKEVFSTYVEVFLAQAEELEQTRSFLHIRGGVSVITFDASRNSSFSPHTWRCFYDEDTNPVVMSVFSTYVEVFPRPG